MSPLAIRCPACGFSRVIDEGAVPAGRVQARCPRCQETFLFAKDAGVPARVPGGAAPPPAPGREKAPPGKAGERRPAPAAPRKAPMPARGRRRIRAAVCVAACGMVAMGAAWMSVFKVTPIVKEKLLIVALFSRVPPAQRIAIRALRQYPTRHVAVSLVVFVNLKNLQEVPDPEKPETPEEKARRLATRRRDLKLAERATETLCLLTGQSFGTYFKLERYGHSWGSLSEERWPTVLGQVNTWALRTLGGVELPLGGLGVPGAPPQAAAAPEAGEAR